MSREVMGAAIFGWRKPSISSSGSVTSELMKVALAPSQ